MTPATASGNAPLAAQLRLIRAAADFLEQAGIDGLSVWADPGEIVIQVPGTSGGTLARTGKVARLAAIAGCLPAPDPHPGRTRGWIHARGTFAGHRVHIYTPVSQEEAP